MVLPKVIFVSMLLSLSAFSAEVDQFTGRNQELKDSKELLNQKGNKAISEAIKVANQNGHCDEEVLYKELQVYYSNHFKGKLTIDVIADPTIEKRAVSIKESVYQDWTPWDGVGMGLKILNKSGLTISPVMRVGDLYVGTDKLEHMFGQGFSYFSAIYLKGKDPVKVIKGGIFREKFILGGHKIGNGVFSYGDLSANFNGMRMWNHMLQKNNDILGSEHNIGPYIACQNNEWAQVKEIDFSSYIDDSMDESINCAKFPTEKTAEKFNERIKMMGMSCPMDQSKLDDMVSKYKHISKWIINTKGSSKVKYFGDFTTN